MDNPWTVVGADHLPVPPIEEFLEFQRVAQQASPNTVRSYVTSLSRWWDYLVFGGVSWDEVTLATFTPFLTSLRSGEPPGVRRLPLCSDGDAVAEATVVARVAAVLSFYRYHEEVPPGAGGRAGSTGWAVGAAVTCPA